MLVVVGNQKGGVGKTTLAVHLAAAWARAHRRVVLVDTDRQESATAWLADQTAVEVVAASTAGLGARLQAMAQQYQAVIVDTPPGLDRPLREAIRVADLLLVPLAPSPVDVRAVRSVLELVQILRGTSLDVRLVLSRVIAGTVLGKTAREALEPYGARIARTVITQRVAVQEASAYGKSVFDYAGDSLAAVEFTQIAKEVWHDVFHPESAGALADGHRGS
jgi:chromosome partitioning protein